MSYLVLARKWRPQAFDDVTGQEHVVRTLANAIAQNRVAHAFLLCGPRGVGKTTTARLLARALNCATGPTATPCGSCEPCREIVAGSSVDVVEIDGASNNGVDNVRELRETARYLPQRDRHKVFIIDEVHMLSVAAFNALLKTLEEPPPHVKFIFATTDPQKLPDTILSRCQRHNFRRIPASSMVARLREIADAEKVSISDRALSLIARQADGGMRDALSLLDQLLASSGDTVEDAAVEEALGLVDRTVVHSLAGALLGRDGKSLVETLQAVYDRGVDPRRLCEELAWHVRDLIYVRSVGQAPADRGDVEQKALADQARGVDPAQLTRLFDKVHHTLRELQWAAQPRLALEVALLSALHLAPAQGLADLSARLDSVVGRLGGGGRGATPQPQAPDMAQRQPMAPGPSRGQVPPPATSTEDLVRQVEALARGGRAAPRQAGARPQRGTPPAGSEDEPHGASGGVGRQPLPPIPPRVGPGPVVGRAPMPEGRPPGRGFQPPPSREVPSFTGGAPFDDEPPPPDDEYAPSFDDGFDAPDMGRAFPREVMPGGCATTECGPDEVTPPQPAVGPSWASGAPVAASRGPAVPTPPPSAAPWATATAAPPQRGPVAPTQPPAGAGAAGDDPTVDPHERWRLAIDSLRKKDAIVASFLSEGRLLWIRPGEVALGYTPAKAFHRTQLEGTFSRQAEDFLTSWFGGPTRLRLQEASADAPASVADERRRLRDERARRLRSEAREHPAVLAVQSILGGEIDDIEVLEER